MKLLVDMNLSPKRAAFLKTAGYESQHRSAVGSITAPDVDILMYAGENGFIVLTHDLDFGAILAATQCVKPSVVQLRARDIDPDVIGGQVVAALRQTKMELERGALLTIDTDRRRIRMLPLQMMGE